MKSICRTFTVAILIVIVSCFVNAGELSKYNGLIDQVYNPDMKTASEIKRTIKKTEGFKKLLNSYLISGISYKEIEQTIALIRDLDDFVYLLESAQRVEFERTDNPGIVSLRDHLGITAPTGFAYVLAGRSPYEKEFDTNFVGVTYKARYIKIVPAMTIDSHGLTDSSDQDVLSHELIHSYMWALAAKKGGNWPKWFEEGCALYFSGAKIEEVKVKQYGLVKSTLPPEYANYLRVFIYLSKVKGKAHFCSFVRKSITFGSVYKPMEDFVGNKDYKQLLTETSYWELQRSVFIILAIVWFFFMLNTFLGITSLPRRRRVCQNYMVILNRNRGRVIDPNSPDGKKLAILGPQFESAVYKRTIGAKYLKAAIIEILAGIGGYIWYSYNNFFTF
jgi:hypothetical protein